MALKHVNAVIVGSGAGGGVAAKELATAGLSVVLLERGKFYSAADCRKDDLRNQRTSVLGNAFGPDDERNPRVLVDEKGRETILVASETGYSNNAASVGGGTFSYGAMAWRFMEKDFRMRSTYGTVAGSTLDDWPISYQDLEPYYEKAEWEMGVSGDDSGNPFRAPRRKPFPMPPFPPNREHQVLHAGAKKLGLHPFDIPMLRNTVPYNDRGPCMRCRWCVGFACEVNARTGTHNTVIPKALATGNCELRTECMVKEILVDGKGRARGVAYFDEDDKLREQTADLVIVSGGAVESARLLLNSKSRLFPSGLGNRYDWVGRNLQSHTYAGAVGLFDFDTYDDLGPGAQIAVSDYNHGNPGLAGGAVLANEFLRLPYQLLGLAPSYVPSWGPEHKEWVRNAFKRTVVVLAPVQEMPVFEARVEADPKVKDYWGIPVARLSGGRHPHSIEIGRFMAAKAEEWLKASGAVETWRRQPPSGLSGGQHQAGTCRMGNDPKTSVVDKYCRIHDVDNVYVIDGSVHVTNGGFNPALTILAVAYYASDNLVRTWKNTRGRS
ncbi:MAG: GMC family oxidoreductase [Bryobacteraceae bacterium]